MPRSLRLLLPALVLALGGGLLTATSAPGAPRVVPAPDDAACAAAPPVGLTSAWCQLRTGTMSLQGLLPVVPRLPGTAAATLSYTVEQRLRLLRDPERRPDPNTCTLAANCPVDPRVTQRRWRASGGVVVPVLWTARSGATLSGNVWATRSGAAKRPAVVLVSGSILAWEPVYWYLAQALARAGFVVLTYDGQGEGWSDQFGEGPDRREGAFAGTPVLGLLNTPQVPGLGGNGTTFYDGGIDALDFLLSTPAAPFVPRPSRTSGTSHAAKQARRVAEGRNAAHNPLWSLVDADRVGVTGHSYGAEAASWIAQADPRVDAAVALDSLCVPEGPLDEVAAFSSINSDTGTPHFPYLFPRACFGTPDDPTPPLRTPVLGLTGDYIVNAPFLGPTAREAKVRASQALSAAGVDSAQLVLRGVNHVDFTDIPGLPVTARGLDVVSWYTTAWFLRYLARDPRGERMLLTDRWLADPVAAAAFPSGHPNVLSGRFSSRLAFTRLDGTRVGCEDVVRGCVGATGRGADGVAGDYRFDR